MPALRDPRHERLAQGLAEGKSQEKAYVEAGYKPKSARANASVLLKRNQNISERVRELIELRRRADERAFEAMVEETKVDRLWVERQLLDLVERCMQSRPVLDKAG